MASSGIMTTGSVVTRGDANKERATFNDDDLTGEGMICWQGILSDTFHSSAADSMVEVGVGMIDDKTPKTGTEERVVLVE